MRYTESRLQRLAMELLRDLDKETVDFGPNYDESLHRAARAAGPLPEPAGQRLGGYRGRHGHQHPAAQPRRGHRRDDDADRQPGGHHRRAHDGACRARTSRPAAPSWAATASASAYETGRGSITVRGKAHIEQTSTGRTRIIITEIPYQVNKSKLVTQDRRPRPREEAHRDLATCATSPTARACASSSSSRTTASRRSCSTSSSSTRSSSRASA